MISKSVRAPPGGSIAASTSWKRRSALVNVPHFSRNADAGRTTSAYLVVSFSKISWQTRNSSDFERVHHVRRVRIGLGDVLAEDPTSPSGRPATAASNICGIV